MGFSRRSCAVAAAAFSLTVLTTGCESKVSQCNSLIKVANAATTEIQAMGKTETDDKVGQMTKFATALDKYSKDVDAVEVKDEKLLGFKQRLSGLYSGTADASRSLVTAITKNDQAGAQASLQKLIAGAPQEAAIIGELNGYCSAK